MSDDPYARPGTGADRPGGVRARPTGAPSARGPGGRADFDVRVCLSEAWAATWANFPLWLGVLGVGLVAAVLAAVSVIGVFLVLPVLLWGSIRFTLRMVDGGATLGDLFEGFSRYGAALSSMGGLILLLLVVQVVGQSVQTVGTFAQDDTVIRVGKLVNLAFGLFVLPRLSFAYLFAVDAGCAPVEAISRAWLITQGLVWRVAALVLVNLLVVLLGLLALGVGVIPATVMANLTWISAYRQMVGESTAARAPTAWSSGAPSADPLW